MAHVCCEVTVTKTALSPPSTKSIPLNNPSLKVWARMLDKFYAFGAGGFAINGDWLQITPGKDGSFLIGTHAVKRHTVVCVDIPMPHTGKQPGLKVVFVLDPTIESSGLVAHTVTIELPTMNEQVKVALLTHYSLVEVVRDRIFTSREIGDVYHTTKGFVKPLRQNVRVANAYTSLCAISTRFTRNMSQQIFDTKCKNAAYLGAAIATSDNRSEIERGRSLHPIAIDVTNPPVAAKSSRQRAKTNPLASDIAVTLGTARSVSTVKLGGLELKGKDFIRVKRGKYNLPSGFTYHGRLNGVAMIVNSKTRQITTIFPLIDVIEAAVSAGEMSSAALKRWTILFDSELEKIENLVNTARIAAQSVKEMSEK